jgi:hypothetical protein
MNFIPVKRRFIVGGLVVLSGGFMALSLWFGTQEISAEALAHRYATAPSKFLLLPNGTTALSRIPTVGSARLRLALAVARGKLVAVLVGAMGATASLVDAYRHG